MDFPHLKLTDLSDFRPKKALHLKDIEDIHRGVGARGVNLLA
jgi:hypothetical protein